MAQCCTYTSHLYAKDSANQILLRNKNVLLNSPASSWTSAPSKRLVSGHLRIYSIHPGYGTKAQQSALVNAATNQWRSVTDVDANC